jgi:hypothetical protein
VCEPLPLPETAEFNGTCSRFNDCEAGDLRIVPVQQGTPCDGVEGVCDGAGNCVPNRPSPPPVDPTEPPDGLDPPEPIPPYCGVTGVPVEIWGWNATGESCGAVNVAEPGAPARYGCRVFVDYDGDPRDTPNCDEACQAAGVLLGNRLRCVAQWDEANRRACLGDDVCRCDPSVNRGPRTCFDRDDDDFVCDCVPVE